MNISKVITNGYKGKIFLLGSELHWLGALGLPDSGYWAALVNPVYPGHLCEFL